MRVVRAGLGGRSGGVVKRTDVGDGGGAGVAVDEGGGASVAAGIGRGVKVGRAVAAARRVAGAGGGGAVGGVLHPARSVLTTSVAAIVMRFMDASVSSLIRRELGGERA